MEKTAAGSHWGVFDPELLSRLLTKFYSFMQVDAGGSQSIHASVYRESQLPGDSLRRVLYRRLLIRRGSNLRDRGFHCIDLCQAANKISGIWTCAYKKVAGVVVLEVGVQKSLTVAGLFNDPSTGVSHDGYDFPSQDGCAAPRPPSYETSGGMSATSARCPSSREFVSKAQIGSSGSQMLSDREMSFHQLPSYEEAERVQWDEWMKPWKNIPLRKGHTRVPPNTFEESRQMQGNAWVWMKADRVNEPQMDAVERMNLFGRRRNCVNSSVQQGSSGGAP